MNSAPSCGNWSIQCLSDLSLASPVSCWCLACFSPGHVVWTQSDNLSHDALACHICDRIELEGELERLLISGSLVLMLPPRFASLLVRNHLPVDPPPCWFLASFLSPRLERPREACSPTAPGSPDLSVLLSFRTVASTFLLGRLASPPAPGWFHLAFSRSIEIVACNSPRWCHITEESLSLAGNWKSRERETGRERERERKRERKRERERHERAAILSISLRFKPPNWGKRQRGI